MTTPKTRCDYCGHPSSFVGYDRCKRCRKYQAIVPTEDDALTGGHWEFNHLTQIFDWIEDVA